jgi:hypothetical protein
MQKNKKIKNATPINFQDLKFKSTIEKTIYLALIQEGIVPLYEGFTYTLSDSIRPGITPYYTRRKVDGKNVLALEMSPLSSITYTPDFTFLYNGIFVIIEVKGFVNDTYPLKRNLFRKLLEEVEIPTMYFEVRSKKELLLALEKVKMETPKIRQLRKLILNLPEKDIPACNRYLENRDYESMQQAVDAAIKRVKKYEEKYADIDLDSLYVLQSELTIINLYEESI